MKLRDYQLECLKAIESKQDTGINRQIVVLPTGAGKTVIFSELIKDRNLKTLVIAHRIELLEQAKDKLEKAAPEMSVGIFCGDEKCHEKQVTIASIQSASRPKALELLKNEDYQLLIIDEAHHAAAKTYRKLIEELGFHADDPKKLLVGFTATPRRGDNVRLDDLFQEIVYSYTIRKLVNRGYLIKPHGIHVKLGIDLSKVQKQMGDFQKGSLKEIMSTKNSRSIVVDTLKKYAKNRRSIVFAVDIAHSESLKNDIVAAGFSCAAVHSRVPADDRKDILKDFAAGRLQFVTNPMILTEGFDCPVADCMINAAPTMNRSLYIQKAGRVLRLHPDKKDALLIDFGITSKRHHLCTAMTLMGDEIVFRVVKDRKELQPKEKLNSIDFSVISMNPQEKHYNPLEGFSSDRPYNPLDVQMVNHLLDEENLFNPSYWKEEKRKASEKQISFLLDLAKKTNTRIPPKSVLETQLGMEHASKAIQHLKSKNLKLEKQKQEEPITNHQVYFLESISDEFKEKLHLESKKIRSMKKEEARRMISKFKKLCMEESTSQENVVTA